jgi:hypothetical protein
MDMAMLAQLQSAEGVAALARAEAFGVTDENHLSCISKLRAEFPAELARAALETVLLRRKATVKFECASQMLFTREALEQASGEIVSRYRAERFAQFETVADLCCGIGGDAIALAKDHPIVAVDRDPLRLALAAHNLAIYGVRQRVTIIEGDVLTVPLSEFRAAFFDPDRRADGERHVAMRHYQPRPDKMRQRLPSDLPLGIKLAPGIAWSDLKQLDAEIEFISVNGELKECVAWFGPLKGPRRRATLLPSRATLAADKPAASRIGKPAAFLYDPDSAILRAGLVSDLADQLEGTQIDEQIAYITASHERPTPFATCYQIDEVHPFNAKLLDERLRALRVGTITITSRGSAVDPAKLLQKLRLDGQNDRTIVLTRVADQPIMAICQRTQ